MAELARRRTGVTEGEAAGRSRKSTTAFGTCADNAAPNNNRFAFPIGGRAHRVARGEGNQNKTTTMMRKQNSVMRIMKAIRREMIAAILLCGGTSIVIATVHCLSVPGTEVSEVIANFCNTSAPSCYKITYSPPKGQCVAAPEQFRKWCEDIVVLGEELSYPGTCTGGGGCSYGIPTLTRYNWTTIIAWGEYPVSQC